ncbi:hypothetical protein LCGC14_0933240 [marine sediment metagenome]|uniref:Uncharacterized protein n=1 Tax=marine sediment metagenome TaxID=412755 RepID=A0A0F9NRZ6_9ZZZZ
MKNAKYVDDLSKKIEALQNPNSDYVKSIEAKLIKERGRVAKIGYHELSMKIENIKIIEDRIKEKEERLRKLEDMEKKGKKTTYTANYKSTNTIANEIKRSKSFIKGLKDKLTKLEG